MDPISIIHESYIEVSTWTRLAEVDAYAGRKGIDRATAINQLVNAALSHGLDQR
jgi:S-adenosylmethionine/arginine decarboxylase-like enzyme